MEKVKIEKLVYGGQGLARLNNKVIFAWNALPGEEVEVEITENKKSYSEGIARNILVPSHDRVSPRDESFLSTSPWQILSFEKENEWKLEIAKEIYWKNGKVELPAFEIAADPDVQYGYRNKIEYSFTGVHGQPELAFYERGGKDKMAVPEGCSLAMPSMNAHARHVVEWIRAQNIPLEALKTLIVRADHAGHVGAGLYVMDEIKVNSGPSCECKAGFVAYLSNPKSPASVVDKVLFEQGSLTFEETLRDKKLRYGFLSFFQINVPLFAHAVDDMARFIKKDDTLVDFYSGVGSISIPLSAFAKSSSLVDSNEDAIQHAKRNIILNGLTTYTAQCAPAEKALGAITSNCTLIMDPPRAGLHINVIKKIIKEQPPRILYMSCDGSTHARDISYLLPWYEIKFFKLYNFFPRTPHVEALCVLERKMDKKNP